MERSKRFLFLVNMSLYVGNVRNASGTRVV